MHNSRISNEGTGRNKLTCAISVSIACGEDGCHHKPMEIVSGDEDTIVRQNDF